jgi:hypothetical protein
MIMGLLLDDYRSSVDTARSNVGSVGLPPDGGLSHPNADKLCVPGSGSARSVICYYRDMAKGPRQSENDLLRREAKAIALSKKCPVCNWLPQWKSAVGPHPVLPSDTVYCTKKCYETASGLND